MINDSKKSIPKKFNFAKNSNNQKFFLKAIAFLMLATFITGSLLDWKVSAAGTITGRVFQDFNGNGNFDTSGGTATSVAAIDSGVAGVTVTAYDSNGAAQGTATTIADGTYSLSAGGTGPYRLEYTTLPTGFQPSARNTNSLLGGSATNSGSAVQFVADGTTPDVNLAISRPSQYCQNNPLVCIPQAVRGNVDGNSLRTFPYDYSTQLDGNINIATTGAPSRATNELTPSNIALNQDIGTVHGIAWNRNTRNLYASAFVKRVAKLGALSGNATTDQSTGAIYVKNNPAAASPAAALYVDLDDVFGANTAGANPHPISTTDWTLDLDVDADTVPTVGKRGLGDLEISDDGSTLYSVNLFDRRLYLIPTSGTLNSTTVTRFNIPTTGLTTNGGTCPTADVRPFGLGKDASGQIYVGAVCSAESTTGTDAVRRSYLHAFVWRFTGSAFTLVANRTLNYSRPNATDNEPWLNGDNSSAPELILTDIEFDGSAMIVGFRDKNGDETAETNADRGYGEILRATTTNGTTWTFESDPSTSATEFYKDLTGDNREEGVQGSLLQVPGFNHTMMTAYDPVAYDGAGNRIGNFFTGGVQRYSNTSGTMLGAYDVYLSAEDGSASTFRKANGLGDIEALCDSAPIEIGNRVWRDANANGVQDPQESRAGTGYVSLAGITVRLYNSSNVLVATAITDQDGEYYFTSGTAVDPDLTDNIGIVNGGIQPNAAYQIRFDNAANFAASGVLAGLTSTRANATQQLGADDSSDSDAFRVTNPTGSPTAGTFPVINYTTGAAGSNDHTLDVGFVSPVSIGSTVFQDPNNNGLLDAGENGIGGVTIELLFDADNNGTISGAELTAVATTTTSTVAGSVGNYFFDNLAPGNYQVRIPTPPTGFELSSANTDTADNQQDNDDNGSQTGGAGAATVSPVINLTLGAEPLNATETGQGGAQDDAATDANGDMTVDFGFVAPTYSLGNRVWFDTNNDGQINGGEFGTSGVSLTLLDSSNNPVDNPNLPGVQDYTVTTDASGYYRFDTLPAGSYKVRVNTGNFTGTAVLSGYQNTTGNTAADLDSTATAGQNGEDGINPTGAANTVLTNGILSNTITLGAAAEPINEADVQSGGQGAADNLANMTVDFGFYRMNLSGTLWNDFGAGTPAFANNGILNPGEPGIASVRVQLFDSSNNEILVGPDGILGTADDAANGVLTNSSGNYNFQGLPQGQYRVVVTPGTRTSSTPTSINPNDNVDNNDDGTPQTAGAFNGRVISGLVTLTPGNAGALGNNTVANASGTTSNPTVDFGFILAPTVVRLEKFDAYTDGTSVELKWSTGDEAGNLGFNIYREVKGKRQLLNAAPIAGNALRFGAQLTASGGDYHWTDREYVSGAVYYLEDLDADGSANLHGAVAPQFKSDSDRQPNARMFSELAKAAEESASNVKTIVGGGKPVAATIKMSSSSILAQQQKIAALGGAKITVKRDGWYRVSAEQMQAAGFDANSNPQQWQLFTDGAEVPFKLNDDRSIEFFGRGLDTVLTDKQVYYLIGGQANGLRINQAKGGAAGETADATSFGVTVERRDRAIYVSALLNGDQDNWFGAAVVRNSPTVQNLNAFNVNANAQARLSVKLQGVVAVEHLVSVRFNDMELGTVNFDGFENKQFEFDLPTGAVREGVNVVQLQSGGANNDASLIEAIRLSYRRGYTASNNQLRFSVPANQTVRVNGFSDANISVYEIRNGAARQQVFGAAENSGGNYGFSLAAASADREMFAVANSGVEQATAVERNAPSSWSKTSNQADFVIITSGELRESADTLAAMRAAQNLQTKVVLVDDLFDEFTYGRRDPNAVRQFLKTATTLWQTRPNYALLFGDSSYDARNNLGLSVTRDIVPTKSVDTAFMETSSDAWLADFDEDGAEDIALGRLPVGNSEEAAKAIEKLTLFDNQVALREKTNVLVADTGFESFSQDLQTLLPADVRAIRIDRNAMTDAETHQNIVAQLNNNPLLVTYTGHGSQTVWAASSIFHSSDAAALTNDRLSFYLLMNCLNGYTHQPSGESLAEALFRSERGAVAVWTSSGITHPDQQAAISRAFTTLAFNARNSQPVRIGDVIKAAKRASGDADVRRTWQLVGDPTVFVR